MRCIVLLEGKIHNQIEIEISLWKIESGDISELYTKIAEQFPDNDFLDIVCDHVRYFYNHIQCKVTIY